MSYVSNSTNRFGTIIHFYHLRTLNVLAKEQIFNIDPRQANGGTMHVKYN